ncbi:hypothetical protein [Litorivivens sp.]|uniref:5' nucleotidase, NT5C type n=1 Tax=Litorivivens sp. TaxID=2020868 RepID=UPI00356308AF
MEHRIVYIDMDGVLCDYASAAREAIESRPDITYPQSIPGIFEGLAPIEGAIEAYHWFQNHPQLKVYILTAPSVRNPACYTEKRVWVEKHLGLPATYRLILNPNKSLNLGDYLIDDHTSGKGQEGFTGKLIHFGSVEFPNWPGVIQYFKEQYGDS